MPGERLIFVTFRECEPVERAVDQVRRLAEASGAVRADVLIERLGCLFHVHVHLDVEGLQIEARARRPCATLAMDDAVDRTTSLVRALIPVRRACVGY